MALTMRAGLLVLVLICLEFQAGECASASSIKNAARREIGSTHWSYKSKTVTGANTNKCNIFVADILRAERAPAPNRWLWYSPIGAGEWKNKQSSYLKKARCWSLCTTPTIGDVIAEGGHVGIVTGSKKTTSATHDNVVENDWGFRPGSNPTCWRYQYNKSRC